MNTNILLKFLAVAALLFGVLPIDAQRVSELTPVLSYWDLTYRGEPDSVDCIFNDENKELCISGFDTDGKGTFWFAGGEPLRVSCFKGTQLQWRREVAPQRTLYAMMRLRGDSIYLVHDLDRELIVMHKDGRGDIRHTPLAVEKIKEGVMHRKYFVLCDKTLTGRWKYYYKLSLFDYDGRLLACDTVNYELSESLMRPMPTRIINKLKMYVIPANYKGFYRGNALFRHNDGFALNTVDDKFSPLAFKMPQVGVHEYFDLQPLEVLTDMTDDMCHTRSPEAGILRGTHYYYVGFRTDSNRLFVVDYDIDKMFPEYVDRAKKWDAELGL